MVGSCGETLPIITQSTTQAVCGDGIVQQGEACDDGNDSNFDECTDRCQLTSCGDGNVSAQTDQAGNYIEDCDDGNQSETDACSNGCRYARCGDAILRTDLTSGDRGFEECDDGNQVSGDGCSSACLKEVCGNGQIDPGERCDDGDKVEVNGCTSTCQLARCGDGIQCVDRAPAEAGYEECDDGNATDTDRCTSDCRVARCGDGFVQDAVEECDDHNVFAQDGCTNRCRRARCGDAVLQIGVEGCDDGNLIDGDSCQADCTLESCGNGELDPGEECDDGNEEDTDNCLNTCFLARCGDGVIRAGFEVCDDGNRYSTDACINSCQHARCGDSIVQRDVEQCDDGNEIDGDGCEIVNVSNDGSPHPMKRITSTANQYGLRERSAPTLALLAALTSAVTSCAPALPAIDQRTLLRACGNNVLDEGELCDDGNRSNLDDCTNECTLARCGDGYVYSESSQPDAALEACDDANQVQTDDCLNDCTTARCGDGFIQSETENCDDQNQAPGDGCSSNCQLERCGNGQIDPGEGCDDGNADDGDHCSNRCTIAYCGDGFTRDSVPPDTVGYESCDDGNNNNADGCTNQCTVARCGDGVVRTDLRLGVIGAEECDDGNDLDTDSCTSTCHFARCGDGWVEDGVEYCDHDGDQTDCPRTCAPERCGDGVIDGDEACDDGNRLNTDACTSGGILARCGDGGCRLGAEGYDHNQQAGDSCTGVLNTCGNASVDSGEDCDGGDSCTAQCLSIRSASACGPGPSCDSNNGSLADGIYWLGADHEQPFQAYCDMTSNGGGWTLLFQRNGGVEERTTEYPNLHGFIEAQAGSPHALGYSDRYSLGLARYPSQLTEYRMVQYDAQLRADLDDAMILRMDQLPFRRGDGTWVTSDVHQVCNHLGRECIDNAIFDYFPRGVSFGYCDQVEPEHTIFGAYHVCHSRSRRRPNDLFGNRLSVNEMKIFGIDGANTAYAERVFAR